MNSNNEVADDLQPAVDDHGDVLTPEEGIADLQRQLDIERARRAQVERERDQANRTAHIANLEKDDTNMQLVAGAISNLEAENNAMVADYATALRNGDFERGAEIQSDISSTQAKLLQLRNGLQAMQERPKAVPTQPVVGDPVEAFITQRGITQKSASWLRARPEYITDARLNRKMIAAHELAVADGIPADTDDYFAAIEKTLGVKSKAQPAVEDDEDATSGAAKATQRRSSTSAAPAAAPVSRGQPSRSTARLSAAEREMAADLGMTDAEYANQKTKLIEEGRLK